MRTVMILAIVAACGVVAGCSKKSSLYLEPGRVADAPRTAPDSAPQSPAGVQKASHIESAQR